MWLMIYVIFMYVHFLVPHIILHFRIKSDHNSDNSADIVREWLTRVQDDYHKVYAYDDDTESSKRERAK